MEEIIEIMTQRLRDKRIYQYNSKREMARQVGIAHDVYESFEDYGHITLRNLLILAIKLDEVEMFESLFSKKSSFTEPD